MIRDRRGFTLVELIVVSVLGTLVLGAVLQVLILNQRTYTAQTAVVQGQQSNRMAVEVLFNELREVSPSGGDILAMNATSLSVRIMRKLGVVCGLDLSPTASPPQVTVLDHSGDDFAVNDTVFVFAENREATPSDDAWVRTHVDQVDSSGCFGRPGWEVQLDTAGGIFTADTVRVGAPIRSYTHYTFLVGTWNGLPYLLRREGPPGSTQIPWPIAGPIRASGGLSFVYRDALGNVTTTPSQVRQIEVKIRSGGQMLDAVGQSVADSIDVWIHTRN